MPRRTSSGRISAALPSRPIERACFRRGAGRHARQRLVEAARLFIEVAAAQAEVDPALLALDDQRHRAGEGGGQRLRAAHAAEAGGQDPAPGQTPAVVLPARFDEGLVGALDDALAADVDPRAGGHLAVHHQALAIELVEVLPASPTSAPGSSSRSARAARRRGFGTRRPACRSAPAASRRAAAPSASRGSRRSNPSCAPPCRCRRRRRARRGSRRPRGRGCSGSSGRPLR